MLISLREGLRGIVDSISRKKGNYVVAHTPTDDPSLVENPFTMAIGSYRVVKAGGGFIISIGLNREKLIKLRDWCNELLVERDKAGKEEA
jgi:hypothetical protein